MDGHRHQTRPPPQRRQTCHDPVCAPASTHLTVPPFDLVHARTLLVKFAPGWYGWPSQTAGWPAWNRTRSTRCAIGKHPVYTWIRELFRAAFGRHGADLFICRRLAELYRHAGLRDIGIETSLGP